MYMIAETTNVPITRLFTNLQQRLVNDTNDFQLVYQLARLHSMTYATNLVEVQVRKKEKTAFFYYPGSDAGVPKAVNPPADTQSRQAGLQHLTNAILLYERAIVLLKNSTNINEQRWMILPTQLGLAWCLDQVGRRDDAVNVYRKTLRIAWKQEVTGDFDVKQWVKDVWEDVKTGKNPIHARHQGYIGPGVCYSEETIAYLLKLLDPVKDAEEISRLKKDQQTLNSMGRAVTPIIIPLDSSAALTNLLDTTAQVSFDLDGSGLPRRWGWITSKAAWLVFDPGRTGEIKSALQMFGNVTFWIFWRDGYAALAALDDDGDGTLRGPELRGLALWNDVNRDGISDPGEVVPVEALGICAIGCTSRTHSSGIKWNPIGVTFTNGTSRPTYDWIAPSSAEIKGGDQ
jgi:hypothetical protein